MRQSHNEHEIIGQILVGFLLLAGFLLLVDTILNCWR